MTGVVPDSVVQSNPSCIGSGSIGTDFGYDYYRNYSAPDVVVHGLAGGVDKIEINSIIGFQKFMLERFEKSNAKLQDFNMLSQQRFDVTSVEFKHHVRMLKQLKRDLISLRERVVKYKTSITRKYVVGSDS